MKGCSWNKDFCLVVTVDGLPWQKQIGFTSVAKILRKLEHTSSFFIRTLSYINVRPLHPFLPLSGPNIGWVHNKSVQSGSAFLVFVHEIRSPLRNLFYRLQKKEKKNTIRYTQRYDSFILGVEHLWGILSPTIRRRKEFGDSSIESVWTLLLVGETKLTCIIARRRCPFV